MKERIIEIKTLKSKPIVFLHGFLGTSADWEPICTLLSKHLCLCVDLPGHGSSPFTKNFSTIMPDLPKMHLVGYSMGGRLAMQYAEAFPEKIATLTLLSAHCGIENSLEKQKRLHLDEAWAKKMIRSFDGFLVEWYDQPIFAGFTPDLSMRRKQNGAELSKSLIHYSLGKQSILRPKNPLFIVGERDKKYRALYPNAIVIPNAGHMVHLENPQAIANILEQRILL